MSDRLPLREETAEEMTWRLEDIFADEDQWEEELKEVGDLTFRIREYEGRISMKRSGYTKNACSSLTASAATRTCGTIRTPAIPITRSWN